jgi:hypothetical protein
VGLAIALTLLSLSFYVFKIFGFAISLGFIFNLFLIFFNPISKKDLQIIFLFSVFFFCNLIYQFWALDLLEFLKTFFLMIIAIYSFLNFPKFDYKFITSNVLKNVIFFSSLLIIVFGFFQVFYFLIFKSTDLYFLFDSISISTAKSAGRFQAVNLLSYIRPISFYHEPSYLGSILLLLFISSISLKMSKFFSVFLFFGILGSLSMTVYFFTFVFLIYEFRRFYFFYILSFLSFFIIILFSSNLDLSFFRFSELTLPGSSGHERIIAPFNSILYEFNFVSTIFGRALGQTQKQLDNSFYVLLSYFGVFLPLLFYFVFIHVKKIFCNNENVIIFFIFFFNMLFLNGAIITPESQFLLFFMFLVLKNKIP